MEDFSNLIDFGQVLGPEIYLKSYNMPNVVETEYGEADMTDHLNLNLILGIAVLLGFDPYVCTCTQYFDMERIPTLVWLVIQSS